MITFTVLPFFSSKLLLMKYLIIQSLHAVMYMFFEREIKTIMAPFRNGVVLYNKAVTKGTEQKVLN